MNSQYAIIEASSASVKTADITRGYMIWFTSQDDAQSFADSQTGYLSGNLPTPASWITGIGGDIGSGIESGFVHFLTDLWDVILGPLEIIAGSILGLIILMYAFKDDLMSIAPQLIPLLAALGEQARG